MLPPPRKPADPALLPLPVLGEPWPGLLGRRPEGMADARQLAMYTSTGSLESGSLLQKTNKEAGAALAMAELLAPGWLPCQAAWLNQATHLPVGELPGLKLLCRTEAPLGDEEANWEPSVGPASLMLGSASRRSLCRLRRRKMSRTARERATPTEEGCGGGVQGWKVGRQQPLRVWQLGKAVLTCRSNAHNRADCK